jgi:D-glycero-alpha-D-manno-heptose 1-phosphate guanylyltransferase
VHLSEKTLNTCVPFLQHGNGYVNYRIQRVFEKGACNRLPGNILSCDGGAFMSAILMPVTAFVLVGGMGTRLRSVVSDRPKPMALVEGVPFVEILLNSLAQKGVRDFVLLTGYGGEIIRNCFQGWKAPEVDVRFSQEEQPLGTGGAVKHAERFATDPTLLVNGDTFYDADLADLLRFHRAMDASVTLSLMPVDDPGRYGTVLVNSDGKVTGFHEKQEVSSGPGLINAGCSLLSAEFIRELPGGREFSMEQEIFPPLARSGRMFGLCQDRAFFDIGTPASYDAFKQFVRDRTGS